MQSGLSALAIELKRVAMVVATRAASGVLLYLHFVASLINMSIESSWALLGSFLY